MIFESEPEFDAEYAAAERAAAALGGEEFLDQLRAGSIGRSGANCLRAAEFLLAPGAGEDQLPSGVQLLAEAFAACGHIAIVAAAVRRIFSRWRDDIHQSHRWRDAFQDRLFHTGASALLSRFDRLLDGDAQDKIFVVGMNKTGTTSLKVALQQADILCGPQQQHELLFPDWTQRRFDRIIDLCRYYEAFQDIPFSLPFTYQALDQAFPDARFILSMRDSAEQWCDSLVRFHTKALFGGRPPSWELVEAHDYGYPSALAECSRAFWRWQDFGLYDRQRAIDLYSRHNDNVREYFYGREEKLLVINLAESDAYPRFQRFLNLAAGAGQFSRYVDG